MLRILKAQNKLTCICCGKTIEIKQARFQTNLKNTTKDIDICWSCAEHILYEALKK